MTVKNASTMTNSIRVTAKKSLGQNFLVNEGVLDRIVAAAQLSAADTVVEIGPGTGALTRRLGATGARVIAIEKDARLIGPLRESFAASPNVTVTEGDVLKWRPDLPGGSYKVVANIPYYLTSHLLRHLLEEWPRPSCAVLMVQSEVADRILASPPDMNLLALSVRLYATPSRVMRVSRGSFRPMPDVDSAVIRLDIPTSDSGASGSAPAILAIARRAFAHKRKQLKATVPVKALERAGISPSARPQELSAEQWGEVAAAFQ
jgi:16S rRNA (adenine1518-N6/adenine1519-N6)-dimethyltransferase